MKKILALLIIVIPAVLPAKEAPERISMAVFGISANNCPESTGRAITEILSGHLFRAKLFLLLDKDQIERIAAREGVATTRDYDIPVLARIGAKLSVNKIIGGSVNKVGNRYTLEIRAIDVATAAVDTTISVLITDNDDFEAEIRKAAYRIERYYLGYDTISGKIDLIATPSVMYPIGSMTRTFATATGVSLGVNVNDIFESPVCFTFLTSYYRGMGLHEGVKFAHLFPTQLLFGLQYRAAKNINMIASAGPGVLFSYIEADANRKPFEGEYIYEKGTYFNPIVVARFEVDIFLYNRAYLYLSPSYMLVMDPEVPGHLPAIDVGLKYIF